MSTHWAPGSTDLPTSGVTPGTYGDSTHVGQFTVNAAGDITAASSVGISGGGGGGTELDYVERTTDLTVTATSAATAQAWIDGNAVTYDGLTRVKLESWTATAGDSGASSNLIFELYDGSTDLGALIQVDSSSGSILPGYGVRFLTPSAASHTFHVKAWKAAGSPVIHAAPIYLPSWYRITTA